MFNSVLELTGCSSPHLTYLYPPRPKKQCCRGGQSSKYIAQHCGKSHVRQCRGQKTFFACGGLSFNPPHLLFLNSNTGSTLFRIFVANDILHSCILCYPQHLYYNIYLFIKSPGLSSQSRHSTIRPVRCVLGFILPNLTTEEQAVKHNKAVTR